ncbi:MAG TPA: hypothetical protein VKU36_03950 [Candidatus Babeliales bacterium]|nr:hypothetical protein [Candidatus Babeliales bacterium]
MNVRIIYFIFLSLFPLNSLCMKRQGDDIQTLDAQERKKPVVLPKKEYIFQAKKYISEIFEYSIRGLSIHVLRNDPRIEKLCAYDKINLLKDCDEKQRVEIDKAQVKRMYVLGRLPAQEVKAIIRDDFQKINDHLSGNELAAQKILCQSYNIDTTSLAWRFAALDLRDKVNNGIALLKKPNSTTTWSVNLSPIVAMKLEKIMKEYGLEPTSVNVVDMDDKFLVRNSRAWFKGARQQYVEDKDINSLEELESYEKNPQKNLCEYKQISPACFAFNPNIAQETDEEITFTVTHEITHALKGHSQTQASFLGNLLEHAPVKINNVEEIYAQKNFAQWLLTQETMADTLLALQDPYFARCALKRSHYPNSYGYLKVINDDLDMLQSLDAKIAQDKKINATTHPSNSSKTTLRIKLIKEA